MADILKINAVEYGGAVAHVAAFRAFEILSGDDSDLHSSSFDWYGGTQDPEAEETEVLTLAEYTARTASIGEQLWRYGIISGVVVQPELKAEHFTDLPFAYQVAFNTFTATCLGVEHMMRKQQLAAEKAAFEADRAAPAPLALEDSIFEPEASLDDQHGYQKQFLEDQAKLFMERSADTLEKTLSDAATFGVGAMISDAAPSDAPASLSLGHVDQDEINAKETSEDGSEAGVQTQADTSAQGEVPGLDDDGSGTDEQAVQETTNGTAENSEELASSVAAEDGAASGEENAEGGTDDSATAAPLSEPGLQAEDTSAGNDADLKPSKSSKSKIQN